MPKPFLARPAVPESDPAAFGELGMSATSVMQYHDGTNVIPWFVPYTRAQAQVMTSSLLPAAIDSTTTMPLAVGFRLYSIQTSKPARVRLYETAAQRTADLNRALGTDPNSIDGVILDFVSPDTKTYSLSPLVDGSSLEQSPSSDIAMSVTNNDSSAGVITVTFVWIRTE